MTTLKGMDLNGGTREKNVATGHAGKMVTGPVYGWSNVWCNLLLREGNSTMMQKLIPGLVPANTKPNIRGVHTTYAELDHWSPFVLVFAGDNRMFYLEFVKYKPDSILRYLFERAIEHGACGQLEDGSASVLKIPTAYILDVTGVLGVPFPSKVYLSMGDQQVSLQLTTINVPTAVPLLDGLQTCEDLPTIRHSVRELYSFLGGAEGYVDAPLFKLCAALSDHRLYTPGGAVHGYIDLITADSSRLTPEAMQFNPRKEK